LTIDSNISKLGFGLGSAIAADCQGLSGGFLYSCRLQYRAKLRESAMNGLSLKAQINRYWPLWFFWKYGPDRSNTLCQCAHNL